MTGQDRTEDRLGSWSPLAFEVGGAFAPLAFCRGHRSNNYDLGDVIRTLLLESLTLVRFNPIKQHGGAKLTCV